MIFFENYVSNQTNHYWGFELSIQWLNFNFWFLKMGMFENLIIYQFNHTNNHVFQSPDITFKLSENYTILSEIQMHNTMPNCTNLAQNLNNNQKWMPNRGNHNVQQNGKRGKIKQTQIVILWTNSTDGNDHGNAMS